MYSSRMIEGPRPAREEELPAVIGLSNDVFFPRGGGDMGKMFPALFARDAAAHLGIFTDDGAPVALAGMAVRDLHIPGAVIHAACIGSVCTRESHRGRGLAARLMQDAEERAAARGAALILVSGRRGLYRRMGCAEAGLFQVIRIEHSSRVPAVSCAVREWTEEDLPDLAGAYRAEGVRFARGQEEMRTLLRTRSLFSRPARAWIVRVGPRTAAYMVAGGPDARTGPGVLRAGEIAGSRRALLACAPLILDASGAKVLELETTASDAEMASLAHAFGLPVQRIGMRGTLKIIDRPAFFAALEPYIRQRLSTADRGSLRIDCGPTVGFSCGQESLRVGSHEDLAALVFGSLERQPPGPEPGPLSRILDRILPVPLPGYGLSYI